MNDYLKELSTIDDPALKKMDYTIRSKVVKWPKVGQSPLLDDFKAAYPELVDISTGIFCI